MRLKLNYGTLLLALTLTLFLTTFAKGASAQSAAIDEEGLIITLDMELRDLQEIDRCFQERDILREMESEKDKTIVELKSSLSLSKQELDLERRENDLNKRIIEIQEREIDAVNRNFDQMKEVATKAIQLAETSKPKMNWGVIGTLIIAIFTLGLAL